MREEIEITPVNYQRARTRANSRDAIEHEISTSAENDFLQRNGKLIATTGFSAALFAQNATVFELGDNIRRLQVCYKISLVQCETDWFIASYIFLSISMILQVAHAFIALYVHNVNVEKEPAHRKLQRLEDCISLVIIIVNFVESFTIRTQISAFHIPTSTDHILKATQPTTLFVNGSVINCINSK
ncbi:unnamed protein product [Oikopleura dioica]|uniref:Uncharacterized protein n=1 Tax=Oikopleura dioica TaxID=34765 RepID=E4XVU5_OIKDI|nr:unnamed protein product [Oikopleura dioica]